MAAGSSQWGQMLKTLARLHGAGAVPGPRLRGRIGLAVPQAHPSLHRTVTSLDISRRAQPEPCLAVVVPCFNEEPTIAELLSRVLAQPLVAEVLVIDDGSTDGSAEAVEGVGDDRVRLFRQPRNLGKGAALRRGFSESSAPYVVVQDADLEYDPREYATLVQPLLDGRADIVYGSRFLSTGAHRVLYFWHSVGNRILTLVSNMATNLNLTDMETCLLYTSPSPRDS